MPQPLTSNRALARREPAPIAPTASELGDQLNWASAIADAAAALPAAYRKQPGAILLAREWGAARGLDLLTTLQNVAFISGRPVVDATMQRALAARAGYRVIPDPAADRKSCTVTVTDPGGETYTYTYTLEDARVAGLLGKDNWKHHPGEMLVAAATRNAIRNFAPEVLLGVFDRDEIDDTPAAEWVVAESPSVAPATPEQFSLVDAETGEIAPADVFEAEVVEAATADDDEITSGDLRALLRERGVGVSALVKAAQGRWPNDEIGTVSRVAAKGRAECEALIASIIKDAS